jgi:glycosyltransferase involved in cell wall biosynthesis
MKVGICMWARHLGTPALHGVLRHVYRGLASGHEVVFLPPEYGMVAAADRERIAGEFVRRCDVLVGVLDPPVLAARWRLGSSVPFVYFTGGGAPWGAWTVRGHLEHLTTGDVMVVHSAPEAEVAGTLFGNAAVRVVPLPYDEESFFPLGEEELRAVRRKLRFREGDRVVLYSGPLTPEKNVHRLLRIFEVVCRRVPDAHLVLAGAVRPSDLGAFGVASTRFQNTVARLIAGMERPERVRMQPAPDAQRMRELYNVADLEVDLSLDPDDSFGMAQVEAMACGTPVVGAAWGGLRDLVADGVSGGVVSTVPTATGVKLSWWEALNQVVALLEDRAALRDLRGGCLRTAGRFTRARFGAIMEEVLDAAVRGRDEPAEPLRPTPFAEELWAECDPALPGAAFRRGGRSEELHRSLLAPFTALAPAHAPAGEPLEPEQVLSLATPVRTDGDTKLRLDDVFYTSGIEVPAAHRDAVRAILARMRERPAILVRELTGSVFVPGVPGALKWMLETGLALRTRPVRGWIAPDTVGRGLGEPAFAVQQVDRAATDLIVYTA